MAFPQCSAETDDALVGVGEWRISACLPRYDPQHQADLKNPARTHAYSGGKTEDIRHYDSVERPELIPHVLEDFLADAHYPAV
jgi:hypothetical protein